MKPCINHHKCPALLPSDLRYKAGIPKVYKQHQKNIERPQHEQHKANFLSLPALKKCLSGTDLFTGNIKFLNMKPKPLKNVTPM